jgi:hypothetical protein
VTPFVLAAAAVLSAAPEHALLLDRELDPSFTPAEERHDGTRSLHPQHGAERDVDRLGWYVPDFAKLQSGGYAGLVTAGFGYAAFDDILNVSFLYGYTPEEFAGIPVHSGHLVLSGRPFELSIQRFRLIPIYLGVGALVTWGEGYFLKLPERYSSGYYPPTGVHWSAHAGIEANYAPADGAFERHGVYAELTTIDTFLTRYVQNSETLGPEDVVSVALGYRAAF